MPYHRATEGRPWREPGSQGFAPGTTEAGIAVQAPQFEGVENITFPTFVMGVPITNLTQVNDTYYLSEDFRKLSALTP